MAGDKGWDSVLALSSRNVWFNAGGATAHWNGRRISDVPSRLSGDFGALAGTRANSIWLMSYIEEETFVAHWNGSRWSKVQPPDLAGNPAQTVAARGNSVWVVGGWYPPAVVAHWNGSAWSLNRSRIINRNSLAAVLDLGQRDVWGVGEGSTLHFDGRRWKTTPGPALTGSYFGPEIAGLPHGPIYTAGAGADKKALLRRWSGKRWVRIAIPVLSGSSDIDALAVGSNGDVWVGGETYRGNPYNGRPFIARCMPRARFRRGASRGGG